MKKSIQLTMSIRANSTRWQHNQVQVVKNIWLEAPADSFKLFNS